MKKKQFESLCKKILPDLSGFVCKGWLLYMDPVGHILRGFHGEDSGFDPTIFTVSVFVLPLYVPTQYVYFNFGDRLKDERGCSKWWNIQEPDLANKLLDSIQREGLPFLDEVHEPSQLAALIERSPGNMFPRSLEPIAYSLVMAGEYVAAQSALDRLMKSIDLKLDWQVEIMERAKQLRDRLNTDPQAAKQLLAEWEQETRTNLGL